ncbi:unnamed protein product [Arctia plantaginis]|uniref:Zinc finger PHD-type domain-containing protein n=1 Tax=Arctia plantaginis TaxID=874455 RepID=A0A8S1BNG2_ARCPL|nr:unnamed protein product [Arctia plantaginis]
MVQCKKCKLFVSLTKEDIVKCKGVCESVYHKKCVQNNKQFMQTAICEDCHKTKGSPLQSCSRDPTLILNPNETSAEKVLAEVNKKLEVLYNVEKKIEDLTTNVEFYAEMYQTLITFKDESEKKIKSLQQKNVYLEKYNKALEERVQELEMRDKEKNIEIHGVEMLTNEDTKNVAQNLAKKLNLNSDDIEDAQRVGQEKTDETRPKIILVTLRSKSARKKWMLAKKDNIITNNKLYGNGNEKRIYINEDIPKYKRQLLWIVRSKLKPKGFQYIWVQNGNILVKKNNEEKKIFNIRSEDDLNKFQDCQ